jgi:hypothetical protein
MEFRLKIPSMRSFLPVVLVIALLGGFMAADRLTLHWYVPEDSSGEVSTLESDVSSLQEQTSALAGSESLDELLAGAVERIATAVTVNSLVSNFEGPQQLDSPAGVACRDWLLTGEGSITDCGFTR